MKAIKTTKCIIAALLLCGASINAQAQDYYESKHEIAIGVGAGSNSQIINDLSDLCSLSAEALVTSAMTGGTLTGYTTYENKSEVPPISVEYFYHVSKVIGIGGIACFNSKTEDMYCNVQNNASGKQEKENIGEGKKLNLTIMPAVKFDWLRKKNFGLYSKAALGLTYMHEKQTTNYSGSEKEVYNDNSVQFNFHATLIGAEAGSQKFRAFVELGMGEQGIGLMGLRYKF